MNAGSFKKRCGSFVCAIKAMRRVNGYSFSHEAQCYIFATLQGRAAGFKVPVHCKGYSLKEKRNLQSLNQPDCFLTISKGIAALAVLPALLGAPVYYCRSARQLTKLRQQFSR